MTEGDSRPPDSTAAAAPNPEPSAGVPAAAPGAQPSPGASPAATPDGTAAEGADLGRRRFFRSFAQDLVQTAATVVGAATALQRSSFDAATAILSPEATAVAPVVEAAPTASGRAATPPRGFRTAFRLDGELLILVDQRRLPNELVEVQCRTAIDISNEIRDLTIRGGPAIGQAAALGLSLSAARIVNSKPYARRAILRAAQATLIHSRLSSQYLQWTVARVMARYEAVGEFSEDGDLIAQVIRDEAEAIVFEATGDHGRLAEFGLSVLPGTSEQTVSILTHGSTGTLAGGQSATAMAIVQGAMTVGRQVLVHVGEGRPTLDGARVMTWELEQAEIPHVLIADAAAGWLLEAGRIGVVLVGATRIAANGDTANEIGTYPLAVLAARHGVPFYVCAPLGTVDMAAADGRAIPVEQRGAAEVMKWRGTNIAPAETSVLNPVDDVTPHDLITGFVTEEGVLRAPFGPSLAAALEARARRLPRPAQVEAAPAAEAPAANDAPPASETAS